MIAAATTSLLAFNGPVVSRPTRTMGASMAVEDLVGGINDPIFGGTPEGKVWDPLGLGADEASLYRRRCVEIKHGRVCMVAFLGMTVGPNEARAALLPLPPFDARARRPQRGHNTAHPCSLTPPPRRRSQLFQPTHQLLSPSLGLHFDDIPGGIAAIDSVPAAGWLQIIALVGVHELTIAKQDYTKEPGEIPTFLGFKSEDPEVFRNKQLKELKNGRLAMIAVLGELMAQKVPVAHRHA